MRRVLGYASHPRQPEAGHYRLRTAEAREGRLRYEVGLGAKSPPVARSAKRPSPTTSKRAAVAGLSWPLPADCDDRQLAAALFGFSA